MPPRRLGSPWGREYRGLAWLTVSVGLTLVLGLALQLLAIRRLSGGEYATFVFALGLGNVAAAIASAIQPVVAARVHDGSVDGVLPLPPGPLAALTGAATLFVAAVFAPALGFPAALLAVLQVPLHAVVAVGLGSLQGRGSYPALALGYACFAVVRIAFVLLVLPLGRAGEVAFVASLPAGLVATILLLSAFGAFDSRTFRRTVEAARLLPAFATWALASWLLNADAVFARLVLPASEAGHYALAVTLGRQSYYLVTPLMFVLLPVTRAAVGEDQRARFAAIFAVFLVLLAGSAVVLGIAPNAVAGLLTGEDEHGFGTVLRGYAVLGPLGAFASLQLTFLFGLSATPWARGLAALAAVSSPLLALAWSGPAMLAAQALVLTTLVAWATKRGFEATRLAAGSPPTGA